MSDLSTLSITDIRAGILGKKFSAVDVVSSFIARSEKHRDLNAYVTLAKDHALESARATDQEVQRNPEKVKGLSMLGVPVAVKDMILTEGLKTTAASKILENFVAPYDATVVAKLKQAGAIVIGKTNMDEFAMGSSNENSAYQPVLNPWDKKRVPGGSSGGSAAAVAARLAPTALGTDTGGSIRQPASLCSVVGMKPTYGRVSRYGVVAFASSLDQVGPFARSVRDLAITTRVISGHDEQDSTSMNMPVPDFEASIGKSIKGMRIGVPKEYFIKGLDKQVETAVQAGIAELVKLGAEIVEVSLPHTSAGIATYYVIAPAEAASNLARYDGIRYGHRTQNPKDLKDLYSRSRSEGFGAEVKRRIMMGTYVLSAGYYDAYYLRAQKVRALVAQDFKQVFDTKCDLIVCPTAPSTAFKIGEKASDPLSMYLSDVFTIPLNLAGLPGMSIPCGFDNAGLPIGMQLIGKAFDEESIFKVAAAYEGATSWHKKEPTL